MKTGTLVYTFGPDGDNLPGVVISEPNPNGLVKVVFKDGRMFVRHMSRLSPRVQQEGKSENPYDYDVRFKR